MKNIVDITVTQARLFPTDCLPFSQLRVPENAKIVQQAFKFGAVQTDPFGLQISFANGIFDYRGKSINVLSLIFEQRKISIQIRGRSPAADSFYFAVAKLLQSIGNEANADKFEPLLKAEETACVATLDIDFSDLVAPPLWAFIQGDAKRRLQTTYGNPRSISFKNLSFEVKYEIKPELADYDVALASKPITIEPRVSTPLNQRRFFTSSPTDSETHLAILERIEKGIAKSRSKKASKQ